MLITNPKTFAKPRSNGISYAYTRRETSAVFGQQMARIDSRMENAMQRAIMLRRIADRILREKGVVVA